MSSPEVLIGFSWKLYGRTYHISFIITVQKERTGVKAELSAKKAFSEVLHAFEDAGVHYYTQKLFFRDRPEFFVIEWSGRVDDRELARGVLTEKGDSPWLLGMSGKAKESKEASSS